MKAAATLLRPHRFELRAMAFVAVIATAVALLFIGRLEAFGIPSGCFGIAKPDACGSLRPDVEAYFAFADFWGAPIMVALALVSPLVGLILGIALAAKEFDQRTTVLAWSLSPSRRRWLGTRVLPLGAVIFGLGVATGVLGDVVQGLRAPSDDPTRSFDLVWFRGLVDAGVGLSAFGLTLLAGSLLGRLLPALLVAAALVAGVITGVAVMNETTLAGETVLVVVAGQPIAGRVLDSRVLTPDGRIITLEEAYDRYGADAAELGPKSPLKPVVVVNPGEIYPLAVARASIAHAALGLAAIVATFFVTDRRRP